MSRRRAIVQISVEVEYLLVRRMIEKMMARGMRASVIVWMRI